MVPGCIGGDRMGVWWSSSGDQRLRSQSMFGETDRGLIVRFARILTGISERIWGGRD